MSELVASNPPSSVGTSTPSSIVLGTQYIVAPPAGGIDDSAMLAPLIAAGDFLTLQPGLPYVVGGITLPSGLTLYGPGATLKLKAAANASLLTMTGIHVNTTIRDLILDGNGANQSASHPVVDGAAATSYDNLLLEHLVVLNSSGHGVSLGEVTHNANLKRLVGIKVIDYGLVSLGFGIYADYVGGLDIDGGSVSSALGYDCYELGHSGITYLGVEGLMRLRGVTAIQRAVAGAGINFPFSESAEIVDVTCLGCGIWNDTNTANKVTIRGAKVRSCTPAAGYAGIRYGGSNGLIEECDVEVTTLDGIALQGTTSKGNAVKGNRAYSSSGANSGSAFKDGSGAGPTDNLFEGNIGDGTNGGGFNNLLTLNGTFSKAHGNKVGPNGGCFNGLNDVGGNNDLDGNDVVRVFNIPAPAIQATSIARNNKGYNPVGVVTPAVPASTVAVAAQPYDREFYITTGAGATTVAIQGGPTITLQASVAGQFVSVPAGKTMTPTYANAPTWVVEGR